MTLSAEQTEYYSDSIAGYLWCEGITFENYDREEAMVFLEKTCLPTALKKHLLENENQVLEILKKYLKMKAKEIQQELIAYAKENGLKMASIKAQYHPCPIPNIGGSTLWKIYKGRYVCEGSLAIVELFFNNLDKNA